MKALLISFLFASLCPVLLYSQCISPPPAPIANGTEIAAVDNENITSANTRWFSGSATTFNSLTLSGGTLVVAGDLTVDKFYMTDGVIFINAGARFVIGSGIGAGLQLQGNCAIYNYGTLEVQRNLSLEGGHASSLQPNLLINALNTSVFTMSNQYLVINNTDSWFVNNGQTDAWGIITDAQSSPNAVCLGNGSTTRMAILINKIANSYSVPTGTACLHVFQFSQFFSRLTSNKGLLVCLPATHHSDSGCIPFGCQPNNWGDAEVFSNCSGCPSLLLLSVEFSQIDVHANRYGGNTLTWDLSNPAPAGRFRIMHSPDGNNFRVVDSLPVNSRAATNWSFTDDHPFTGSNFYRVDFSSEDGRYVQSKIIKAATIAPGQLVIYPVPFNRQFFVRYPENLVAQSVSVTDVTGRAIPIRYTIQPRSQLVTIDFRESIAAGMYVVHVATDKKFLSQTVIKQ